MINVELDRSIVSAFSGRLRAVIAIIYFITSILFYYYFIISLIAQFKFRNYLIVLILFFFCYRWVMEIVAVMFAVIQGYSKNNH